MRSFIFLMLGFSWLFFSGCSPDQQPQSTAPAAPPAASQPAAPQRQVVSTNQPPAGTTEAAEDPAFVQAIAKAKASSGDFLRAFREKPEGTKAFFVKKPYPTPTGGTEHMWIAVLEETNGTLKGKISNDADETREVKKGDIVSFNVSEISDWKYTDGKKLVGGFTIRYFFERMSPQEKEDFLKQAGFEM